MPGYIHQPGKVGVISQLGTLTYEAVWQLSTRDIGQSTCLGIGGDPINGTSFIDCLSMFEDGRPDRGRRDDRRDRRHGRGRGRGLHQGEHEQAGRGFIAGATAPPGKRMGHAGAIISGGKGTAAEKQEALRAAGIAVAETPAEIGATLATAIGK
jgi:succinyl-CoA synthetase alpha subunit